MERRRREWDQHVTRIDAERLVKTTRDNTLVGRRSPGRPKRRLSDLIMAKSPTKKKKKTKIRTYTHTYINGFHFIRYFSLNIILKLLTIESTIPKWLDYLMARALSPIGKDSADASSNAFSFSSAVSFFHTQTVGDAH